MIDLFSFENLKKEMNNAMGYPRCLSFYLKARCFEDQVFCVFIQIFFIICSFFIQGESEDLVYINIYLCISLFPYK